MKNKTFTKTSSLLVAAMMLTVVAATVQAAAPKPTPAGSTIEQRIAQRKSEQDVRLAEKEIRRITTRCKQAQAKLIAKKQELTEKLAARKLAYEKLDGKILIIIGQLKLAEQDTFELEKQRAAYDDLTAGFDAISREFLLAVDDSAVMGCETDPAGFLSMLQTSRQYMQAIKDQSESIRVHVTDAVKPELTRLGERL